jgi:hypothetical protein
MNNITDYYNFYYKIKIKTNNTNKLTVILKEIKVTLHKIVNNDIFLLITGISSILSLLIGLWAIKNIYNINKKIFTNSGRDSISVKAKGIKSQAAGRDIINGR